MTTTEFSTEFDVLYNNVTSNQAPGLNEYEKSVFLTKAQSQLLWEYFNVRTDGVGGGFDGSVKRQYDFSSLVETTTLVNVNEASTIVPDSAKIDKRSHVFLFPKDFFLTVNEIVSDSKWQYSVLPLNYSEYQKLMLKPYNFPIKRAAWRLLNGLLEASSVSTKDVEFITPYTKMSITVRITRDSYEPYEGETLTDDTIWFSSDENNPSAPMVMLNAYLEEFTSPTKANCVITLAFDDSNSHTDSEYVRIAYLGFKEALKRGVPNSTIVRVAKMINCLQAIKIKTDYVIDEGSSIIFNTIPSNLKSTLAELIGNFTGEVSYKLRYVKTPSPIILDYLTNYGNATLEGLSDVTECKLPPETHQEILERAVTLAKIAWQGGTITQAAARQKEQ